VAVEAVETALAVKGFAMVTGWAKQLTPAMAAAMPQFRFRHSQYRTRTIWRYYGAKSL
jgi:hypothetical protein